MGGPHASAPSAASIAGGAIRDAIAPLGLDDHERRAPVPPRLGQDEPKQSIARAEFRIADPAFTCVELQAQGEVLEDQFVMSAACQGQRGS